jgi:hypothetical protein
MCSERIRETKLVRYVMVVELPLIFMLRAMGRGTGEVLCRRVM